MKLPEKKTLSVPQFNAKREALAACARALREHQLEIWTQYEWCDRATTQEISDEYYSVIHGIERQIVELDKKEA